jgi:hypothetical protein
MNINSKYKNSVFTTLFDDPALLRELYCALGGVSLPPDVPVTINTLENVLYMDFNNDISFEIGGKLVVLIEHQSTVNPNIALRLLVYITRILEKKARSRTLYSKKRLPIPWPEFFVLYNGTDPFPDSAAVRLSDLFEKPQELGLPEKAPQLELYVQVININEGRNEAIVSRCKKLSEYSGFIAKVRHFNQELGNLEEAIKTAVQYCQKHGILEGYLEIHGSEVLNMILTEWNTEDAIAFAREEGFEDGIGVGIEKGREEGMERGIEKGQKYILDLINQGFSAEELKQYISRGPK